MKILHGQGKQDRSGKAIQQIYDFQSFNLRLIPSIALEHLECVLSEERKLGVISGFGLKRGEKV